MTVVGRSAPRASRRRAGADRDSTSRRILDAAFAELAAHGEVGLSLRSIARAVGMSVQSLYHYFDSRAALVDALARESTEALAEAVHGAADARTVDKMVTAAEAFLRWAGEHPAAFTLLHGRGLPVGTCGCTDTGARMRSALLGPSTGPAAEARVSFWAIVYALAAGGCGPCRTVWKPVVADAAARAVRAHG